MKNDSTVNQMQVMDIKSGDGGSPKQFDEQSEEAVNDDNMPLFTDNTGDPIQNAAETKSDVFIQEEGASMPNFPSNNNSGTKSKSVENYGAKKTAQLPSINSKSTTT